MSKYDPLRDFLLQVPPDISEKTLTFREIESILGFSLPRSAYRHRPWWANPSSTYDHPHAQAWLAAGWKVGSVNLSQQWIQFHRETGSKPVRVISAKVPVHQLSQTSGQSMKIVIQCAGSKYESAGRLTTVHGEEVLFVAHPEMYNLQRKCYRPDDIREGTAFTWREYLETYNRQGSNPDRLYQAGELYKPPIYQALIREFGVMNVFILSAGWGLVRSDYLIPDYDITFSNQGQPYSKRRQNDWFKDFNQLSTMSFQSDETIYFFGGQSYLSLFQKLTNSIKARKVIYHAHEATLQIQGYECIPNPFRGRTNWHYACAFGFINGTVSR